MALYDGLERTNIPICLFRRRRSAAGAEPQTLFWPLGSQKGYPVTRFKYWVARKATQYLNQQTVAYLGGGAMGAMPPPPLWRQRRPPWAPKAPTAPSQRQWFTAFLTRRRRYPVKKAVKCTSGVITRPSDMQRRPCVFTGASLDQEAPFRLQRRPCLPKKANKTFL